MLLLYGTGTVQKDWHVKETCPTSYCRIYYIYSGDVIYRDGYQVRQLKAGHLYIFPSTRPYEMQHDPCRPLNCLFLHIDIIPHLLSELLELQVTEGSFLHSILNTMEIWLHTEYSYKDFYSVMEPLASSLLAYLNSNALLQDAPDKLADTILYIARHVSEKISVDTLSKLCGCHTQYYIRLFRIHLGTTPHQYLINYRMKLALYLLMDGKNVSETAYMVGYPEPRNFTRVFKKYYGYSPSQIKKYVYFSAIQNKI